MALFRSLLLLFCGLSANAALAHPHSYIDLKSRWQVTDNKLTAMDIVWLLDEMTSLSLTYDALQAASHAQAMENIANELVQNMQETHFFTQLRVDDKPIPLTYIPNSAAVTQRDLNIVFTFSLAPAEPVTLSKTQLQLLTYEPTYYVSMEYANSLDIDNQALPAQCKSKLIHPDYTQALQDYALSLDKDEAPEDDMNLGRQFAQELIVTCQ